MTKEFRLDRGLSTEKVKIFILFFLPLIFFSCSDDSPVTYTQTSSLKGVYILYQSSTLNADYAYFDAETENITNDIFKTTNGYPLGFSPGDMHIYNNKDLFITCMGSSPSDGTIYKINADNNLLIHSLQFGTNPYGFTIDNNQIFAANVGSDYVTKLNSDLNIVRDSISVGSMPSNVLFGFNQYIVCKLNTTSELSLASINQSNYTVRKIFLNYVPVSSTFNVYGFFISGGTTKTIYRYEPDELTIVDSITIPTQLGYLGDIFTKSTTSFYVVAGNKEIWQINIAASGQLSAVKKIASSNDITITGAAYENLRNEIFIADNNNGVSNGEMHTFDATTGFIKHTYQLGGKTPVRFAFRY